jgi:predicted transposase/invertase (TIGR01784 family)
MGSRQLHPLADPVFKRIFGEEKEILMDLINAVIGLEHPVVKIEYLTNELLPESTDDKTTLVDVRCTDDQNRHFILEMQVLQQKDFHKRVLYNAARVYGRQIGKGFNYESLQPVYSICFVDHVIEQDTMHWKHKYSIIREDNPKRKIPDLQLHFIELSKCRKRSNFNMTDPLDRWIRFFVDPQFTNEISMEKNYEYPFIKKAVELLDESNYTKGQLYTYDKYLDSIMTWNSVMIHQYEEGMEKGIEKGMAKGKEEGIKLTLSIIRDLKANISIEEIAAKYQVEENWVNTLRDSLLD